MDGLDLYRRIEFPNETRASWLVERHDDGIFPIFGSLLRRLITKDVEERAA